MADEKDEVVEIEVVDTPEIVVEDKPEADKKIVTPEEGLHELKTKLADAQRERDEEKNRRLQAEGRVQKVTVEKEDGEIAQITSAIDVVKQRLEVAKGNYKTARANNDVDAELEATELIAQSKHDLSSLEAGKAFRENQKKNPQPQRIEYSDPVEALASTLAPASAAWVRSHPEYARSQPLYDKMVAASNWAIANGHPANTQAYFSQVEKMLGVEGGAPERQSEHVEVNAETPMSGASRPVAPASAPVSRNGAGPGQPRPGTIRLTRQQAEIAEASFPDMKASDAHRAYARNMSDLKSQGRLN